MYVEKELTKQYFCWRYVPIWFFADASVCWWYSGVCTKFLYFLWIKILPRKYVLLYTHVRYLRILLGQNTSSNSPMYLFFNWLKSRFHHMHLSRFFSSPCGFYHLQLLYWRPCWNHALPVFPSRIKLNPFPISNQLFRGNTF